MKFLFAKILLVVVAVFMLGACQSPDIRKRAFGYFRLGNIVNFPPGSITNVENEGLLIRFDERGLSAMSTLCTYDLSNLKFNGKEFTSPNSTSRYDTFGRILNGPTKAPLPYFELVVDASIYQGPKDTLYAKVGEEVSPEWRLAPIK